MRITVYMYKDIQDNGEENEVQVDCEVVMGTADRFCGEFGNYLPGDPDEVSIYAVSVDGELLEDDDAQQVIDLIGENNVYARALELADEA